MTVFNDTNKVPVFDSATNRAKYAAHGHRIEIVRVFGVAGIEIATRNGRLPLLRDRPVG